MSEFSQALIERSGYERDGFAETYDRFRPAPAASVLEILAHIAQIGRARLVVDLGAGTASQPVPGPSAPTRL